jgi:hypothetical protein
MTKTYVRPTLRQAGNFKKDTGFAGRFRNDAANIIRFWRA